PTQLRARWFFRALSKKPLQEPIVACALGKLYNKDSILEYLLDKSVYGDGERICGHIRSLKDVKTLRLTPNTSVSSASSNDDSAERAKFICPFSLKEMNGSQPFLYIWTCGCVFSQAGLKTMTSNSPTPPKEDEKDATSTLVDLCPQCSAKYSKADDVILLNPSPEEEQKSREARERRRASEPTKSKKSKKRKNGDDDAEPASKKTKTAPLPSTNPNIAAASRAVISSLAMEEAKKKASINDAVQVAIWRCGRRGRRPSRLRGTFYTKYRGPFFHLLNLVDIWAGQKFSVYTVTP
ncbi:hypothetical protein MPER_02818, partial [Moniliophthora perniciosa FA553]